MSRQDVIDLLYIVAFAFFITGLRMLRGPRTAVRGNQIAAVGMAIAVGATLAQEGVLKLDFDDEVIAGACITRGGEIVHARAKEVAG